MRTSSYQTARFHHDGDVDGCMYLVDTHNVELITTLQDLVAAVAAQPDNDFVVITGPDAAVHDRFQVTAPTYREIAQGPWTCLTVQVARTDLEAFLVYARTKVLERAIEELDVSELPYTDAIEKLNTAIKALSELRPKKNSET